MNYRRLGRSGLKVSELVLGTMNFGGVTDEKESIHIINRAVDEGINIIDCADIYNNGKSEEIAGKALASGIKRSSVFITSKTFYPLSDEPNAGGNSKHHIINACEESLRRLKTDYIDIYFLHRYDKDIPIEESLYALDLLVQQGKVRYTGCSTFPPWKTTEAMMYAESHNLPAFIAEEPPYNLLDRRIENEIIPMAIRFDLGLITWSPLAQGILAGKYKSIDYLPPGSRGSQRTVYKERITEKGIEVSQRLKSWIKDRDYSLARFSVAWVLKNKAVSGVILGPRTIDQFTELIGASNINLNNEDIEFCDSLVPPGRFVSNHFNTSRWMK
ncbi:MAG: aldo/keto reductase [Spirochaetales bacterium]|nr:aldo/keto reductase [Spirochaetales bacterium]